MIFITLYLMFEKDWMIVVYNLLIQLLFLGIILFMIPPIVAGDHAHSTSTAYTTIRTSIRPALIVLWILALFGCFFATMMTYKNKFIAFLLYPVNGIGVIVAPILIINSGNPYKTQALKQAKSTGESAQPT